MCTLLFQCSEAPYPPYACACAVRHCVTGTRRHTVEKSSDTIILMHDAVLSAACTTGHSNRISNEQLLVSLPAS